MAKLINGNGNRAIYAAQDADLIASLAGNVTCIANVGNKYAATIEDANTIGLADGVIITKEGRRIQLDAGDVDLFAIPTGSSGVTNYYIIGYKLVQQADSSQVAETFVQKMNSSSATIAEGTLRGGDNEVYVSVYRVTQVEFTIDSVNALLPELRTLQDGGDASDVSFDNTGTGISASNVQDALEEIDDEKANLLGGNSFNGVQILRDSRAWADIPNGSSGETTLEFKDKNGLNMGYIRPWKKSDGSKMFLDIYPPDNGEIHLDGKIPVTKDQIVNSLLSTATDVPLSAYQGNVLRDPTRRKAAVTPTSSGYATLLEYINNVVYPMNIGVYSFQASGFSDLPVNNWGFTVIVISEGGAITVIAYKHLSSTEYYVRSENVSNAWAGNWNLLALNNFEIKTFSVTTDSSGLYNTSLSVNNYFIVSAFSNHANALMVTPFASGVNWYLKVSNNDFTNYGQSTSTITCLCYKYA